MCPRWLAWRPRCSSWPWWPVCFRPGGHRDSIRVRCSEHRKIVVYRAGAVIERFAAGGVDSRPRRRCRPAVARSAAARALVEEHNRRQDTMTFASATLTLVLVAIAAGYISARCATRVEPATALRSG